MEEISDRLGGLSRKVDELIGRPSTETLLSRIRRLLFQSLQFKLELTGLRPDRPIEPGRFEDLFVLPAIKNLGTTYALKQEALLEKPARMREIFLGMASRQIVIGPPGSGKTTWAEWLQNEQLIRSDGRLAIMIRLRDVRPADLPSLQMIVREAGGPHLAEEVEPRHIRQWLDAGRVALIFDGFDEIAPNDRDTVVEWLNALEGSAGISPIVVTSRPLSGGHLDHLHTFEGPWKIENFDKRRVVDYIKRWYDCSPLLQDNQRQIDADLLGSTWLADPVIGPLTGNPLMLTTLLNQGMRLLCRAPVSELMTVPFIRAETLLQFSSRSDRSVPLIYNSCRSSSKISHE